MADDDGWSFGPFYLDRRHRVLLADGKPVRLDAKAFELLEYLLLRRDEAPTRDEILAHVWRGVTVSENNLAVQMSALRRALLERGGGDKLILTLPGRRYRFVGEVFTPQPQAPSDLPPASTAAQSATNRDDNPAAVGQPLRKPRRHASLAVCLGSLALAAMLLSIHPWRKQAPHAPYLSIMILPFANLGGDNTLGYLADSVTDNLTTELAKIPDSLVIARETAETYRGRPLRVGQIGQDLHVRYLLEGGVYPTRNALQVNARLIDTASGAEIWAKRFDLSEGTLFDHTTLMTDQIAAALGTVLVRAESERSIKEQPDNPGAVDEFLRARSILDGGDRLQDYEAAQVLLEDAVRKVPQSELVLSQLGWLLISKVSNLDDPSEDEDEARAEEIIARALVQSPNNVQARAAQARLLSIRGDYAGAISAAEEALSLQPNSSEALWALANATFYQGHMEEAEAPLRLSLRIDPEGPTSRLLNFRLGQIQLYEEKYSEAIHLLQIASAGDVMPEPGSDSWSRRERVRLMLIAAEQLNGDQDETRRLFADYRTRWPHRTIWRIRALAPKTLSVLPGYAKFLLALQQAGMPSYADETVDEHVPEQTFPLRGDIFTATPMTVPRAKTITTMEVARLKKRNDPRLIIDIGTGTAVMEGATWSDSLDRKDGDNAFVDGLARVFQARFPLAPIVIMADGTYGIASYNAALHVASWSKAPVYWYRGGEEAWTKAGFQGSYRRSD